MGAAPTGAQYAIRPWDLGRSLLVYLASRGVGIYNPDAIIGNTLFMDQMPDAPVVAGALVPDAAPAPRGGLSRPHYTLYLRDTDVTSGGTRAALAFEALHEIRPLLADYHVFITCDGLPSSYMKNVNRFPVHVLNISTAGMVKRA
jgi:hypothetical protein